MSRLTAGALQLRQWRERSELNGITAAKLLGIDQSLYSKFERGARRPTLELAFKLEKITGIPASAWTVEVDDEPVAAPGDEDTDPRNADAIAG